jgi:hypothetical protein
LSNRFLEQKPKDNTDAGEKKQANVRASLEIRFLSLLKSDAQKAASNEMR